MTVTLDNIQNMLREIMRILDDRARSLTIAPTQVVTLQGLSDIDTRLGLIQAGEFRAGNGRLPGDSFTGVRIGYPPFNYEDDEWHIAGVNADVLQVGINAEDGKLYFGAGTGILSGEGIALTATGSLIDSHGYKFVLESDPDIILGGTYGVADGTHGSIRLRAQAETGSGILTTTASVDAVAQTTAEARFTADSGGYAGNASMFTLRQTATVRRLFTSDVLETFLDSSLLVNESRADADTQIWGMGSSAAVIVVDASENRLEIGFDHIFATRDASNKNTYINEANQDMDFIVRSVNSDVLFGVDAGGDFAFYKDVPLRELIGSTRTYYVRTDGSDSNTGLVDSAGGAFLTIQAAINAAQALDFKSSNVVIQVRDGTYTGANTILGWVGTGTLTIQGNSGTPANVVISTTSADCFLVDGTIPSTLIIKDMKLQTTTAGCCLKSKGTGNMNFANINFGACATFHILAESNGSLITSTSNYAISGAAACHYVTSNGGALRINSLTCTITGTPAFSSQFTFATRHSVMEIYSITYSGSATGTRYTVSENSVVWTNIAGANFFPGNAAGSTSTGGQYI